MKRTYYLLLILVLVVAHVHAQTDPPVLNSIVVTDNNPITEARTLYFGLAVDATDTWDAQYAENPVPPFPPSGTFEAQLFYPAGSFNGTESGYRDIRGAVLPFTGQKEFRIRFQKSQAASTIQLSWNLPPNVTGNLRDIINGNVRNINMSGIGSYEEALPGSITQYRMYINYDNALPVELTSFSYSLFQGDIILSWSTANEVNNYGFAVERSIDSKNWTEIGFVAGSGNSNSRKEYSYTDKNFGEANKLYYRLKQMDTDGTVEYSKDLTVLLDVPENYVLNQNYPNPFNPNTTISFALPRSGAVKITVYDVLGNQMDEVVNSYFEAGIHAIPWNATNFPSGVYYYKLESAGFNKTLKMQLIK